MPQDHHTMYTSLCRLLPLALLATTLGCDKPKEDAKQDDKKADAKKDDAKKDDDKKADAKKTVAVVDNAVADDSSVSDCTSSYSVVGAVASAVLSESIDGVVFTDSSPFQCRLKNSNQSVQFSFNDSATDASSGCDYALTYKSGGEEFSGTQTLNCTNASLEFTVTGTPNATNKKCDGLGPISEDPLIQLKTNQCGGGAK